MVASVEVSLLASIEALNGEELSNIVASFEPEEMMALMAEIDEEIGEDSSGATTVESWTPDDEWAAEQDELDRFDSQDVWTLTPRDPSGPKPLTWVWVKEWRSGELKARLCLRPFGKRVTRSKNELYCPTPLSYSLKLLLVYAVVKDYAIYFFDVSRAFLYTPIRELVYAEVPKEYLHAPNDGTDWVFMLNKTVYGLNEAMIDFDDHFEEVVTGKWQDSKLNMKRFLSDPCSYTDREQEVSMSKHVDDGCLVGPDEAASASLCLYDCLYSIPTDCVGISILLGRGGANTTSREHCSSTLSDIRASRLYAARMLFQSSG